LLPHNGKFCFVVEAYQVADAPADSASVLHSGHPVEGIGGDEKLVVQNCIEVWEFFKAARFGIPFFMT